MTAQNPTQKPPLRNSASWHLLGQDSPASLWKNSFFSLSLSKTSIIKHRLIDPHTLRHRPLGCRGMGEARGTWQRAGSKFIEYGGRRRQPGWAPRSPVLQPPASITNIPLFVMVIVLLAINLYRWKFAWNQFWNAPNYSQVAKAVTRAFAEMPYRFSSWMWTSTSKALEFTLYIYVCFKVCQRMCFLKSKVSNRRIADT